MDRRRVSGRGEEIAALAVGENPARFIKASKIEELLDLASAVEVRMIAGKRVYSMGSGALPVCLSVLIAFSEVEPLARGAFPRRAIRW